MQCKKCGTDIQDNSKFCPSCGSPVNEVPEKEASAPAKSGGIMKTIGKVIGGLVVLAMIGTIIFYIAFDYYLIIWFQVLILYHLKN